MSYDRAKHMGELETRYVDIIGDPCYRYTKAIKEKLMRDIGYAFLIIYFKFYYG